MPITVELQEMYSYSYLVIGIAILLAVIAIIAIIAALRMKTKTIKKRPVRQQTSVAPVRPLNKNQLKHRYITMLVDLENSSRNDKVSNRQAYQELSRIVRQFASEVTGLKVQNYILEEIKRMNMPELYAMIAECYVPEFAWNKNGDIHESINKARKVIEEWN